MPLGLIVLLLLEMAEWTSVLRPPDLDFDLGGLGRGGGVRRRLFARGLTGGLDCD